MALCFLSVWVLLSPAYAETPVVLRDPAGLDAWEEPFSLGDLVLRITTSCPRVEIDRVPAGYRVVVCDERGRVLPPRVVEGHDEQARESSVFLALSLVDPIELDLIVTGGDPVTAREEAEVEVVVERYTVPEQAPAPLREDPVQASAGVEATVDAASADLTGGVTATQARPAGPGSLAAVPPVPPEERDPDGFPSLLEPEPVPSLERRALPPVSAWVYPALGLSWGQSISGSGELGAALRFSDCWEVGLSGWADGPAELTVAAGKQSTWALGVGATGVWHSVLPLSARATLGGAWRSWSEQGEAVTTRWKPVTRLHLGLSLPLGRLRVGPVLGGELGLGADRLWVGEELVSKRWPLSLVAGLELSRRGA